VEEDEVPKTNENPVEEPSPDRKWGWRKWLVVVALLIVLLPAVGLTIWSVVALKWSYSEGDRAGYVQKFSKKGWLCKTWEGELSMINIPGAAPERWNFTVRNDSVANVISSLMGKQVSMHYEEHPGVPTSCFGETRYFVKAARQVGQP
jgi:hypothetical protein